MSVWGDARRQAASILAMIKSEGAEKGAKRLHHATTDKSRRTGPGKGKHIVFMADDHEYRSEQVAARAGSVAVQSRLPVNRAF